MNLARLIRIFRWLFSLPDPALKAYKAGYNHLIDLLHAGVEPFSILALLEGQTDPTNFDRGAAQALRDNPDAIRHLLRRHHG